MRAVSDAPGVYVPPHEASSKETVRSEDDTAAEFMMVVPAESEESSKNFACPPFRAYNHNVRAATTAGVRPHNHRRHAPVTARCRTVRSVCCQVVVCWISTLTMGLADSIWSGTVLSSYLYTLMELTGSPNSYAGYVEAAQVPTRV